MEGKQTSVRRQSKHVMACGLRRLSGGAVEWRLLGSAPVDKACHRSISGPLSPLNVAAAAAAAATRIIIISRCRTETAA